MRGRSWSSPKALIPISASLLAITVWGSSATVAKAQASSPATLRSSSTLVVVPTLVQTQARESVYSLTARDFTLTDDGVLQKIDVEANQSDSSRPLALVVLMQIGGAAKGQFALYNHLDTMLADIAGKAPNKVAIVQFDSRPEYDSPFTSDIGEWADAINHPERGNDGAAIFDGLAYALDLLKQQPPNARRAILLISQQHDSGSETKIQDLVRELGENNTAVYSLSFSVEKAKLKEALTGPGHANPPLNLGGVEYQAYFDLGAPLALAIGAMRKNVAAETASLSGGEPFVFSNKEHLDEALNTVANHVKNGYTLSFQPSSPHPGLHTLKVSIPEHPDLIVHARSSYWATALGVVSQP